MSATTFTATSPCGRLTLHHDRRAEGRGLDPILVITARTAPTQQWVDVDELGLAGFHARDGHAFMIGGPAGSPAAPLQGTTKRPAQGVLGHHRWRTVDGPQPSPPHGRCPPPIR
ncbi:hypothetical protein [Streptomyces nigrescens]|uniref:Uncharacterized protein n=1 Tax=Streptomyces nigrescens TaxID=1920 RepID=A0ABY7J1N7_STRNI|nr:hypothetical protein [Streptomyces nigrescens]WAU04072.1 hypothetical protein STRNI_002302 [Streptomyces nigrescens]